MADVELNLESTDSRELLSAGIRYFALGDLSNAVAALGRTTQILAQEYGDEHDKLGDIYIHYAKALLELSREEAAPFGEGIVPEESSSDSDEDENGVVTMDKIEESDVKITNTKETKSEESDKKSVESEENKSKIEKDTDATKGDKDAEAKASKNKDAEAKESKDKDVKAKESNEKNAKVKDSDDDKGKKSSDKDTKSEESGDQKTETSTEKKAKVESLKKTNDTESKSQNSSDKAAKPDGSGDKDTKLDGSGDKTSKVAQNGIPSASPKPGGSGDPMEEDLVKDTEAGESSGTPEEKIEEPTDLQLAWEVLEVAKKIFEKRGDAGKDKVAETMILLGEVAMESGNFEDGTTDMKAGLDMLKSMCEPEDRKLAETYYKLGNALSTIPNIEEAVQNFELSIKTIQLRLTMLNQRITTYVADERKTADERTRVKEEIEELKALIPEIEEKISDTKSIKDEVAAKLFMEMANASPKPKPEEKKKEEPSLSKSINNIAHLVKRKRKAEEESAESTGAVPAKKPTP